MAQEQRAFHRLSERLAQLFPRLPLLLLLDGLYANGPVMQRCRQYHWQVMVMVVLKDDVLPSVWEEVRGLRPLQSNNHLERSWGGRRQHFYWVNGIDYELRQAGRKSLTVHVVVCEETWEVVDEDGQTLTKTARHAWISSLAPLRDTTSTNAATSARAIAGASRANSWWKNMLCTDARLPRWQDARERPRAISMSTPLPWTGAP